MVYFGDTQQLFTEPQAQGQLNDGQNNLRRAVGLDGGGLGHQVKQIKRLLMFL